MKVVDIGVIVAVLFFALSLMYYTDTMPIYMLEDWVRVKPFFEVFVWVLIGISGVELVWEKIKE